MKIVCISDSHSKHRQLDMPSGDILLCAGDICFADKGDVITEEQHVRDFNEWLGGLGYKHIVVIAGNHDSILEDKTRANELITNAHYLDQDLIEIEGLKIYGEPRQPEFFNWAFNVSRKNMELVWDLVPDDVDILLTHGPPHGFGDLTKDLHSPMWGPPALVRVGCKHQRCLMDSRLKESPFKLVVSGHIHSDYGQYQNGPTRVVNCSVVNERYHVVNKPIVIEL